MQNVRFTEQQIRILDLANFIERLPSHRFNMECWLDDNYLPSCIAGWAVWRMLDDVPETKRCEALRSMPIPEEAGHYLGVYGANLRKLFTPHWDDLDDGDPIFASYTTASLYARRRIPPQWAAATLRHLAATGEVDWMMARRQMRPTTRLPELVS